MYQRAQFVFYVYLICLLSPAISLGQPAHDEFAGTPGLEQDDGKPAEGNGQSPSSDTPMARSKRFFAGGKLGANIATFGGPDADRELVESTYKTGLTFNAFARFAFTEHWSVQPELAYTTRGSGVVVGGDEQPPFDFSYFELTVLAHTRWSLSPIDQRIAIYALLGPSVGYLGNAKREDTDLTDIASVDFGLTVGVGLAITLPFGSPFLNGRYYYSFFDLDETQREVSHRAFSILLGYEIGLSL